MRNCCGHSSLNHSNVSISVQAGSSEGMSSNSLGTELVRRKLLQLFSVCVVFIGCWFCGLVFFNK